MMHDRDERTLYARQQDRIAALEAELARAEDALRQANSVRDTFALALVGLVDKGDNLQGHQVDKTPNSQVPNDDEVICPNCAHQFRAIPPNVQAELAAERERSQRIADETRAEILDAVDDDMSLARAEELAKLWQAGKLIGGDAHGVSITLYTALTAARERREAAEKDSARYQWLRDRWFLPGSSLPWCGPASYTENLDAAIDAAMKD